MQRQNIAARLGLAVRLLLWGCLPGVVYAAAAAAEPDTNSPPAATAAGAPVVRPALLPETESLSSVLPQIGAQVGAVDDYQWLGSQDQRSLLVHRRPPQLPGSGVVLLLTAKPGAVSEATLIGRLRTALPAFQWHSYLLGLPLSTGDPKAAQLHSARIKAALVQVAAKHPELPLILLAEGSVGALSAELLTAAQAPSVSGLVLVNHPRPQSRGSTAGPLAQIKIPTLLLQVLPVRYPTELPLAAAVQLRHLPRLSPRQPRSLLVRQVRGWLRRYENLRASAPVGG